MASNYGSLAASNGATKQENGLFVESTPLIDKQVNESTPQTNTRSLWSVLTFGWLSGLLELGNEQERLDQEDLDLIPLPTDCSTDEVVGKFNGLWERERNKSAPSLFLALLHAFGRDFVRAGLLKFIHDICLFVGPQVLNGLIHFLRDKDAPLSRGVSLTVAVTVSQLLMSFCLRHYFFKCYLTGLRVRSALVVAVYKKALVLNSAERQIRTQGEITNLMSIDATRMQDLTTYLHAVWYSFIQIGLALFFLWEQLGPSCLGGVIVIIVMMPVTKAVAKMLGGMQKKLMEAKDARIEVNSEVIGSMKVIKLQAWEESFEKRILALRELELKQLWTYVVGSSLSIMLWSATPLAVALATFAAYIWSGHTLDVANALTALALFDILRFPLFMLPQIINRIVEASVSMNRIRSFLLCDEHAPIDPGNLSETGIRVDNATFAYESKKPKALKGVDIDKKTKDLANKQWEIALLQSQLQDAEKRIRELGRKGVDSFGSEEVSEEEGSAPSLLCLKRIDFECKRGELVAVIGGVGCGKSSFLSAILGEVRLLSGTTAVNGSLSYFSQTPFILNDTVRNNILFGHSNEPVDEEKYQRALSCCALRHDLELLPGGDQTEIGEKGITLSGGQKARVALARNVYHSSDIALLDDPLAAVDAHVGKHLFQKCIIDELLLDKRGNASNGAPTKKRTVILATNALQYLSNPLVDRIIVLRDGRIYEQGTYKELATGNTLFSRFLAVLAETGVSASAAEGTDSDSMPGVSIATGTTASTDSLAALEKAVRRESAKLEEKKPPAASGSLMTDELKERESGHVDKKVYLTWGRAAGGTWVPFIIVLAYGAVEGVNVLSKWWLTYWGGHGDEASQYYFLGIYALINLTAIVATFCRLLLVMACGLKASRQLFDRLLAVIMQAPMSFFDTTPTGRIINRFSKDIYTVDEKLVAALRSYLTTLFSCISTIMVISGVTPIFTICLIPIIIFYLLQQAYFTMTYSELQRLDSVGRSPMYALLGETLEGVSTIRAFCAQATLSERLRNMLDRQQHAYYLTVAGQCWLAIRLELTGTLIITFACLCSVLQHGTKGGDEKFAGLAGLAVSFALSVTQALNWSVRMGSDVEANMVAVERIEEYCKIQSEAPRHTPSDDRVGDDWPTRGEIQFVGSKLRYRPGLPLVLKGLDLHIPAGSKVGVCGRTGAGKSTLMTALLRIVELDSGKILIDGANHRDLGLAKLRSKIAVIPQDPVLFSGTIQSNLDPFDEFSNDKLYEVLERVGLYSTSRPGSSSLSLSSMANVQIQALSDAVSDGGSNFSVGQRQLLVIARALLSNASIVIMDEASAAMDADTDARIQSVMQSEFESATCLTVAHRINTIMDSDYILVMDDGRATEFDTPKVLLERGGMFSDLVEAATAEDHSNGE